MFVHTNAVAPDDPALYGRSFADVYDEWYDDRPTEALVEFVSARVPSGAAVLELGVGTGRIALALAAAGFSVTGLDSSTDMLDRLTAKAGGADIGVIVGDAADPSVYPVGTADVVIAAFNLMFNLSTEAAQQQCFAACARALRPGGLLLVEAFVPRPVDRRRRDVVVRSSTAGRIVLIVTDTTAGGRVDGTHIDVTPDGLRLRPWVVRMATPAALDDMAGRAGLRLDERWEDVEGTPYEAGVSSHHVSVYRRVGDQVPTVAG